MDSKKEDKTDRYQFNTGEQPPPAIYACMSCVGNDPEAIIVPEMAKFLPECPSCGYTIWYRI